MLASLKRSLGFVDPFQLNGLDQCRADLESLFAGLPNNRRSPGKYTPDAVRRGQSRAWRYLYLDDGDAFNGPAHRYRLLEILIDTQRANAPLCAFFRTCCGLTPRDGSPTEAGQGGRQDIYELGKQARAEAQRLIRNNIEAATGPRHDNLDHLPRPADQLTSVQRAIHLAYSAEDPRHAQCLTDVDTIKAAITAADIARAAAGPEGAYDAARMAANSADDERAAYQSHLALTSEQIAESFSGLVGVENVRADLQVLCDVVGATRRQGARRAQPQQASARATLALRPHALLLGSPGTGKTTLARLYGSMLKQSEALSSGHTIEVSVADLFSRYGGDTPRTTRQTIEAARGGVLFIDEAHKLCDEQDQVRDMGTKALNEIMRAMENDPDIAVVFATYTSEHQSLLKMDQGFERRLGKTLTLKDFDDAALIRILDNNCQAAGLRVSDDLKNQVGAAIGSRRGTPSFGNAGEVEKVLQQAYVRQISRLASSPRPQPSPDVLLNEDFFVESPQGGRRLADRNSAAEVASHLRQHPTLPVGEAFRRLWELAGLEGVAQQIRQFGDQLTIAREDAERAQHKCTELTPSEPPRLHLLFLGKPGTGKTTVARLYGSLLRDMGLLEHGHVVEVGPADLLDGYEGRTPGKVKKAIDSASGGVLLVDEVHRWAESREGSLERRALEDLRIAMENHRDKFAVVMVTYPEKESMLQAADAGFTRRFGAFVRFNDYSDDILASILHKKCTARNVELTPCLQKRVAARIGQRRSQRDFGNGGEVENVLQAAMRARASRIIESRRTADAVVEMNLIDQDFADAFVPPSAPAPNNVSWGLMPPPNAPPRST